MFLVKITLSIHLLLMLMLHCSAQSTNMTAVNSTMLMTPSSSKVMVANSTQSTGTPRFIKLNTSISNWAKIGIAVGLSLGMILIAGIVAVSCHCWLRNQKGTVLVPDKDEEEVHLEA